MATVSLKSCVHHLAASLGFANDHPSAAGVNDPFHDPLMLWIGIAFVLMAVVILALTGLIHWGVEYQNPPWNSAAFPPPVPH
jgi:hypothetical protein